MTNQQTKKTSDKPKKKKLFWGILFIILVMPVIVVVIIVISLIWINPPATSFTLREDWDSVNKESYNLRTYWVINEKIPNSMKWAVVASEDQLFWEHNGFDVKSIREAWDERQAGTRFRGASTISQQVAKNLFLSQSASFIRKGIEAGITVLIELFWTKERILEVYLNIAEFGPGVYGIGRAVDVYWGISGSQINADKASRLAAVLPSPKRMRVEPPSPYTSTRSRWILRQMRQLTGESFAGQSQNPPTRTLIDTLSSSDTTETIEYNPRIEPDTINKFYIESDVILDTTDSIESVINTDTIN